MCFYSFLSWRLKELVTRPLTTLFFFFYRLNIYCNYLVILLVILASSWMEAKDDLGK